MATYVCSELVTDPQSGYENCHTWIEYVNTFDMLAITQSEADLISTALIMVIITAWAFRQVHNVILRRRY